MIYEEKIVLTLLFLFFRSYISFDILRRILGNYFGYDIIFVMNITDIDDKIIKRARQNYLYDAYVKEQNSLDCVTDDATAVVNYYEEVVKNTGDPDKKNSLQIMLDKYVKFSKYIVAIALNII